jgi:hypothetical protein
LESNEAENLPEEKFYSSVLDLAHEEATTDSGITLEKVMEPRQLLISPSWIP